MKLPHPIQYQGSKRNLAPKILECFPKNVDRLIEPFAGSAALSIASAYNDMAKRYLLNDLNKPLINLIKEIVDHPVDVVDFYANLWNEQFPDSVEHFYQVREKFNRTQDPKLFLYILSRCVKGSVRYNREGMFNQSPDKRRKGAKPENMARNIQGVSILLKGKTTFNSKDYKEILRCCREGDLIYMDPPYQGVCNNRDTRYFSGISHEGFVNELAQLNNKHIDYIISYDGECGGRKYGEQFPEYLELHKIELEAGRSTQATLLGRESTTRESLYLSPALTEKIDTEKIRIAEKTEQMQLSFK